MSENMKVYEKVRAVPPEALKSINGGRLKGMSDINPMWRIKMLTEVFGLCGIGWKTEIVDKRLEQGSGIEIVCFVDINLYVKVDGEWSAPIPGMGGSSFVTQEKSGPYTSDECFKMAYTDAISVACKSLGFAADVYFEKDRTKYSDQGERATTTRQNAPQTSQQQQSTPPQGSTQQGSGGPQVTYITQAQVNYAHKLKSEKRIPEQDFGRIIEEIGKGKKSIKELTKPEAHELINLLANMQAAS